MKVRQKDIFKEKQWAESKKETLPYNLIGNAPLFISAN